jgi:hypothetical protein
MNERIGDLLALASDDGGTPLGFTGDTIARRARVKRRRRHGGIAVGLAAAGVAGVLVLTQLAGLGLPDSRGPAVGPRTTAATSPDASTSPSASQTPLDPEQQTIVDRCSRLRAPDDLEHRALASATDAPESQTGRVVKAQPRNGTRAELLRSWSLDAYVKDAQGVTATFVNPDHTRWAACYLADGGTDSGDELQSGGPLPHGPVPQSWYGRDGFRHQDTSPSWSQVCSPGEGKVCSHELFAGAFARYAGVASARVDAPDGTVLKPVFGDYTYVFRHTEARVDPHRAPNDMQSLPSMPVSLLDAKGKQIIRYDYYPSYVIPASCPSTGGC